MAFNELPPLALTMGEPAGVGPELALKAWCARQHETVPPFVYVGDATQLRATASQVGIDAAIHLVTDFSAVSEIFDQALPVFQCALPKPVRPGVPDMDNSARVVEAIAQALRLIREDKACGLVTNPIHKKSMWQVGFSFPGHTEYLAAAAQRIWGRSAKVAMMLVVPGLRVVPVTRHIPLKDVPRLLDTETIVETGLIVAGGLAKDFAIHNPRLAIAALNPHGGEDGELGDEESRVIKPAVDALRAEGILVTGPIAADTLFHEDSRRNVDAILCMYHDQALIPLKTLNFYEGVNVTLGLPFVRTSPDHGTAFDIAGQGTAKSGSLISALKMAATIAQERAKSGP